MDPIQGFIGVLVGAMIMYYTLKPELKQVEILREKVSTLTEKLTRATQNKELLGDRKDET